ncbi:MAG: hypothetical protein RIQ60_2089 [Pseudomonadota bacterium]
MRYARSDQRCSTTLEVVEVNAYADLSVRPGDDRSLDQSRLALHECVGTRFVDDGRTRHFVQRPPTCAPAVEHRLPAELATPVCHHRRRESLAPQVVKDVGDTLGVEPCAGIAHTVAVGNAMYHWPRRAHDDSLARCAHICRHSRGVTGAPWVDVQPAAARVARQH